VVNVQRRPFIQIIDVKDPKDLALQLELHVQ